MNRANLVSLALTTLPFSLWRTISSVELYEIDHFELFYDVFSLRFSKFRLLLSLRSNELAIDIKSEDVVHHLTRMISCPGKMKRPKVKNVLDDIAFTPL